MHQGQVFECWHFFHVPHNIDWLHCLHGSSSLLVSSGQKVKIMRDVPQPLQECVSYGTGTRGKKLHTVGKIAKKRNKLCRIDLAYLTGKGYIKLHCKAFIHPR